MQGNPVKSKLKTLGLALFFCLISNIAFAALPTLGTITPSSGTTTPNTAKTFTCKYSDADGWANIKEAYLLINLSTALTNTCYVYYDQNTNLLYLRDDANTSWLGGFAPASANTIENSFVKLNCVSTTATGATSTLTVNWNITFKSTYSGQLFNTYLKVVDDALGTVNWTKKGTYTVNTTPAVGTITPASGTGAVNTPVTFTATYTDLDGWQNIQYVHLLINTSTGYVNCAYLYYDLNSNLLYLRDNANTTWGNGYAPGSANMLENSYCKLDCANTQKTGSGTTLTVTWSVIIKPPFTGTKNTYLYVRDDLNTYNNFTKKGAWTIPNSSPTNGTITPQDAFSKPDQFTTISTTYNDPDTWLNIQYVYLLINTSTSGLNCPYLYYNQNSNLLYIRNDANTSWGTGYAPSSNNILENSYAKLDCKNTTVSGLNQTMTVNWSVSFKPTVTGLKNCYLYVIDDAGSAQALTKKGTRTIDKTPPTGSITINSNNTCAFQASVTLNLSATDDLSGVDKVLFSNDNATWSTPQAYTGAKAWTLLPGDGEKTVYAKFIDKAGNESIVYSDSIMFYAGTVIGPGGGEITSPDGKAKLIIPSGALTAPQPIVIIPLNISQIQNESPDNYSMLIAIQCEPAGLTFLKPVDLIFKLDTPEVPGTLIRLGRKGDTDTEFIPLGRTSAVAADGVTLTFTLATFSSYAGLSSMISQGAPIGSGVKIPLPDLLTGSFSHSIPIAVPPGRKNMQPNVSLQYRSSSANSWCGFGWSINPGYIVRSTKLGPPTYNDLQDTFIFVTDSGSTELTHLVDNLYQAKIESSFAKFYKETDDSWKVVQKDGSVLRFGQNLDSKETATLGTFLWNLTKVIDTNGNYVELTYAKDQGKTYLYLIEYTGNDITGTSASNSVEFTLEDRTDITSSYIFGTEIKTVKRLKEIKVNCQNDLVWRYALTYEYSADTKRSLLKSIKQSASDGTELPAQTFRYQTTQ